MWENVDRLRTFYAAVKRREFEELARYLDAEVEIHPAIQGPDLGAGSSGHFRGREEAVGFFENLGEVWEMITVEPREIRDAGPDRVLMVERWHVRGRQGIELDFEITDVYRFRDGLLIRAEGFRERAEALEAVGLSE